MIYPALMGSKTPTSKFSKSKEFRWELIISGDEENPTD